MGWNGGVKKDVSGLECNFRNIVGLYTVLFGKLKGKGLLGKRKRKCEDNIKRNNYWIDSKDADRIHLVQERDLWRELINKKKKKQTPWPLVRERINTLMNTEFR
jgi:hypothetical protein